MAKMKLNKKGIFFTFIAITIMTVIIIVFAPQDDASLQKDMQATITRISSVDNYVNDLQSSYFEVVLRATTYKSILSLIYYINTTQADLPSFDSAFQEVMINGTINNVQIDTITGKKIMNNSSLTNWSKMISAAAKDSLNVNTTILINNVSATQTTPWSISSRLNMNLSVKSNVAEWNKNSIITATIDVEGFYDPYYLLKTSGSYTNQIKRSGVEFNQWNISKVREHLRNGTYVHWQNSEAPSFLMRFTGTIKNSSCCGIESMANPNKISPSDQIRGYVDYMLWNPEANLPCNEIFNITNPSTGGGLWDEFRYFKLDINHTLMYNITDKDAIRSC